MNKTVAIAGLGAIGLPLARALDAGVDGLRLIAVSCRDEVKARANLAGFRSSPRLVELQALAEADIVVECAPASIFERIAVPALEAGRIFIPASVGALLPRMHLVELAGRTGARIVVPTGALLGLDAVRAAAEGQIDSVTIETRKPPMALAGAPYLKKHDIDVTGSRPALAGVRRECPRRRRRLSRQRQRRRCPRFGRDRANQDPGADLGRPGNHAEHTHHPSRSRGRSLHHDDRERAEYRKPENRPADDACRCWPACGDLSRR